MKPPFERVIDAHGAAVLRVCRAVVGPDDAEDAWSETFISALAAYPELPPEANVEAWLVTIAHRKAIDNLRVRARAAVPVGAVPDRPSTLGTPDPERIELWRAVRALPDKQRQCIAYHYLGGLPFADVAGILGGTPAAARRAAADGIAALRARYRAPGTGAPGNENVSKEDGHEQRS
jgi:RNA polymerase sigma factor (sigma-70 family)